MRPSNRELPPLLRDLIYLDVEKTASLFSQLEGGLIQEVRSEEGQSLDERSIRQYDLKLFKPEFGGVASETTSRIESRILHHDLLARVEERLFEIGAAVDINTAIGADDPDAESIRSLVGDTPCVRVEGWAAIEDYDRFRAIANDFGAVAEFIGRCAMQSIEQTDDYQNLQKQLDTARERAQAETDRNKRITALKEVAKKEEKFREIIQQTVGLGVVDKWLVDGLGLFINTFMPGRINLRIWPVQSAPSFQVLANLKKDCFTDGDLNNTLFAYSARPNVKLTMLGLVTALPRRIDDRINPMIEFEDFPSGENVAFEKGFRKIFSAMGEFENLVRFSRFPNITVHPLAVYRTIHRSRETPETPRTIHRKAAPTVK